MVTLLKIMFRRRSSNGLSGGAEDESISEIGKVKQRMNEASKKKKVVHVL